MEQMPKGRVHSDAKTDVWVCCDLHYQKSNDVIKFLWRHNFVNKVHFNISIRQFLHLNALYLLGFVPSEKDASCLSFRSFCFQVTWLTKYGHDYRKWWQPLKKSKKTFTGFLTNCFSFTSYSYKVGLIRTLVDRAYKINNTWLGLHEDITKLMEILKKNLFPARLIERVVNRYTTGTLSNHCPRGSLPTSPIFYFKLPYIGHFSVVTQKRFVTLLSTIAMIWISN